jgi:hypothetical protein
LPSGFNPFLKYDLKNYASLHHTFPNFAKDPNNQSFSNHKPTFENCQVLIEHANKPDGVEFKQF